MKKRIGAVLMGVLLSTSLIGTNVFAEETEPPVNSETVFEIVEGATGTYVKGSKKDHLMKVRMSATVEKIYIKVDDKELDRDNWSDGNSEEVPPTTEAPSTTEPPTEGPSTTEPPTEGPTTTEPPTEAPPTTAQKVKKSSVKSYNILTPINVQAAEIKDVPVTIKGTYLETLSLGEHKVSVYIAGVEKSVTATINVVAQETTSEAPATSEAPEATTEEDTEDVDDNDEEDTEDESSTTKKDNTTSTKKKTSKKSKSSKTGDNSQIMLYLAIALVSGCAIVYFARKKATK